MTAVSETPTPGQPDIEAEQLWISVRQAATRSGRCYDTVLLACQAYMSGDRSPRALKCTQGGHKCRYSLLRADVDRWVQGQPPSRATRVA